MATEFWLFVLNVIYHWQSLLTGGLIAVGIMIYEVKKGKNVSSRALLSLMALALFISCFLAWHDEHHNAEVLTTEKSQLSSDKNALETRLQDKEDEIGRLRDELSKRPPLNNVRILPQPAQPPMLVGLRIGAQRRIPSTDSLYGTEVVIQTDTTLQPFSIMLACDSEITRGDAFLTSTQTYMKPHMGTVKGHTNWFAVYWDFPQVTPATPVLVHLYSKQDLKCSQVKVADISH